jgi:protein-disulfide isomerase
MRSFIAAVSAQSLSLPLFAAGPPVEPGKTIGSPSAPVMMEIFSDFQCPLCRQFHDQMLPQIEKDYAATGKVFIVYREFPLNIHQNSQETAAYSVAAARMGKYQAVSSAMFKNQGVLSDKAKLWQTVASVLTPAEQKKIQTLAKDPAVIKQMQAELNYGMSSGIDGTPTVFLSRGSRRIPLTGYALNRYELVKAGIDALLK